MDDETINDLKQFIASVVRTTVREELAGALAESEARVEAKLSKKIDQKGDEILDAIATTMQNHIEYVDDRFSNHEKRLAKLEHKPA